MRRVVFLLLAAAFVSASTASAELRPLRRPGGEVAMPLVRAGTIQVPRRRGSPHVRVIVRLGLPPLAAAFGGRLLTGAGRAQLDADSASARAYLARLTAAQRAAEAALRRALPAARVERRYRIVLDGLAVSLPAARLPRLVGLPFVTKVYPSVGYTLATNESPSVIGAPQLAQLTGVRGEGMKIAIVDDGVDQRNRFFRATGYRYPHGFPKGARKWTTPKVIVARSFPGPGSGRRGRRAVDRQASWHGTHVAGIAAGNAGTRAPKGPDHPAVAGLSGVAPHAWLGNYRVFTVPTPIGDQANTPEVVAAFEAAVADGMDVINFSGGSPQVEPTSDALAEAIRNVAAAGVVPVVSAGNDRDEFGLGTAGSPGTAPEAISVAATTNSHVFTPALSVTAPGAPTSVARVPFQPAVSDVPPAWGTRDHTLVDVGSIVGRGGKPVDPQLCGPASNPNGGRNPLPRRSLRGAIALVSRGVCTLDLKAERVRAAGGIGMVLVDNRSGETISIPLVFEVPTGMVSDLDGSRLRAFMAQTRGRTSVRIGRRPRQLETGRSGVVTYFSSAGPTAFGHALKPDVSAPGNSILSSTLPEYARSPFVVFDGTSMAAPHVSGGAALLRQLHPRWTPQEVKSALVSTAGAAWADTARTAEAPVTLEGGGLVDLVAASEPRLFTDPASLSYGDLDVSRGAASRTLLVTLRDAGDGAGTWQVELRPQAATAGATLDVQSTVTISPGGTAFVPVTARAEGDAGLDYGFVVLRRGDVVRRVPYLFVVTEAKLAQLPARRIRRIERGNTFGPSRVGVYRFPTAPFGAPPGYTGPPMNEQGSEHVYSIHVSRPVANVGAAVTEFSPNEALVHPWFLGSQDENDVQGYAGTPVNVNAFMDDFRIDVGAAGAVFPRQKAFFVAVDSGQDQFSGKELPGRFVLRSWVNDVRPPRLRLLTTRVAAGRPLLVARATDRGSGVDPYSILLGYRRVLLSAAAYDPVSGLVAFALPEEAPTIRQGRTSVVLVASDYQETKNVSTPGDAILPNTGFRALRVRGVRGPAVTWITPPRRGCVRGRVRLLVVASSTHPIRAVRFVAGTKSIRTVHRGASGLFATTWRPHRRGRQVLRAVARDARGRTATASRSVRVCR